MEVEIKKLTFFFVNAYIIKGEKTVLFDTGGVLPPEELGGYLAQNGVDPKEIDLIIISHGHYDHCMLAKAWKELSGAKILCHKNAVEYLEAGTKENLFTYSQRAKDYQPMSWLIKMGGLPFAPGMLTYQPYIDFMESTLPPPFPPVTPDIVIGDEDYDLHPYGIPGKLIYTPGHADSSLTLVLDNRIAFTADNFLDLHTLQCLECVYPEGTYSLNWICYDEELLKDSVRKVLACADTYYPGHGPVYTRENIEGLV